MFEDEAISTAVATAKEHRSISLPDLKDEQMQIIRHIVNGKSCLGVLPTGFGKSVCFYAPPVVLDILRPEKHHVAVVISPLKSLMLNQVDVLCKKGLKCATLSALTEEDKADVAAGTIDVLFSSPEAIMSTYGRQIMTSSAFTEQVCVLAFDEGHCISEWGEDFRPKYREVAVIRSFLSQAPVLILTATTTRKVMDSVLDTLMLSHQGIEVVASVPDRPNLRLNVKVAKRYEPELAWYLNVLQTEGVNAPKALIYCRSIADAAAIYAHLLHRLGDSAWLADVRKADKRIVDMYHGSLLQEDQTRITSEFPRTNSVIRCVVATIAFGMGVDVGDIKYVFHWGPSRSILGYWQEVGRCGRSGEKGECYLFITPRSLDPRRIDDSMIDLCKSNECLRVGILQHLVIPGMNVNHLQYLRDRISCSDNCSKCTCHLCSCCSRCYASCRCNSDVNEGAMLNLSL